MPVEPTPDSLSFYIVYMSHYIEPRSVRTYLSGICNQLEPYFPNIRAVRATPLVRKAMAGCLRLYQSPTKRKLPLTRDLLAEVCNHYAQSSKHNDLLFLTLILTGFYGLHRLGELTQSTSKNRDHRKTIKVMTVKILPTHFEYILPYHKADHLFEGNRIVLKKIPHPTDPYKPFIAYYNSRQKLFPFRRELWLTEGGTSPSRDFFLHRFHAFFDSQYGGQSMRAGGATCLAEMGMPPFFIQAAGRWSSDAFQRYIRKNPILMHALTYSERRN